MNMLYYILEANVYLLVFYSLYKIVLQDNTFHQLNRYFLLVSVILAFSMPMVDLSGFFIRTSSGSAGAAYGQPEVSIFPTVLFSMYLSGILFTAARFGLRLKALFVLLRKGRVIGKRDYKLVLVPELENAFSFLNLLFLNPKLKDSEVILLHESVHIRQGHSFDILFLEIVQSLSWFNPFIKMIQADLKIVHEYIADEQTTAANIDSSEYAMFLIGNTLSLPSSHLGSNMFNQSILKKRIMKLNQEKSSSWVRVKYLLAVAMVPVMLGISSVTFAKNYGLIKISSGKMLPQDTIKKKAMAAPAPKNKSVAVKKSQAPKNNPKVDVAKFPQPPVVKVVKFPPPVLKNNKNETEAPPPPPAPPVPAASEQSEDQAPPPPPMPPKKN